jgi:hypothetical protein
MCASAVGLLRTGAVADVETRTRVVKAVQLNGKAGAGRGPFVRPRHVVDDQSGIRILTGHVRDDGSRDLCEEGEGREGRKMRIGDRGRGDDIRRVLSWRMRWLEEVCGRSMESRWESGGSWWVVGER